MTQADGANDKIGLMYDITGRGDKSFNDSAAAGLDKAKADFGIAGHRVDPDRATRDRAERLNLLASSGNGLIIGVGFLWGDAITAGAARRTRASTSASSTRSSTLPTWCR